MVHTFEAGVGGNVGEITFGDVFCIMLSASNTLGMIYINVGEINVWAAVFTFNPYLLISINELLISIIHLLISINIDTASIFIDINNSFIDINNSFIDINNSFIYISIKMDAVSIFIDINK